MRGTRKLLRTRHRNGRSEEQGDAARAALRAIQRHEPRSTRDDAESPRSIDQPLNSALFHSIEGMHNITLVEHREQALDSAHRVVLAGFDILRQDATSILHRAQYRFLVGRVQTELLAQQNRELKQRPADSFPSTCCVITCGSSPGVKGCFSCCPRCATRTCRCMGGGCKPRVCRPTASGLTLRVCEKSLCNAVAASKTLALAIHPRRYFSAGGFARGAAPFLPNNR
jgi:hypothetical protein